MTIKIVAVGDGGCAALEYIAREQLAGVELVAVNTYAAGLAGVQVDTRILIGDSLVGGMGTSGNVDLGRQSGEASEHRFYELLHDADRAILMGGMGGGTATGALPVLASVAQDIGVALVCVVSYPHALEGSQRRIAAQTGVDELEKLTGKRVVVIGLDDLAKMAGSRGTPALAGLYSLSARMMAWTALSRLIG